MCTRKREGEKEGERDREREHLIPVLTAPEAASSLRLKSTSSEFSTSPLEIATTRLAVRAPLATWANAACNRTQKQYCKYMHVYTCSGASTFQCSIIIHYAMAHWH